MRSSLAKDPANVEPAPAMRAYETALEFGIYKAYTVMKLGPFRNFVGIDGLSWKVHNPALYRIGIGLNMVFAALLLPTILTTCVKLLARPRQAGRRSVMSIPVGILLGGFLVAPDRLADVVNIGERFLVAGVVIVLLTVPLRRPLLMATAVITLAAVPLNAWFMLSAPAADASGARAAGSDIRRHGLFSHRLHQFTAQADFLMSGARSTLPPQAFRTSIIVPSQHRYSLDTDGIGH